MLSAFKPNTHPLLNLSHLQRTFYIMINEDVHKSSTATVYGRLDVASLFTILR